MLRLPRMRGRPLAPILGASVLRRIVPTTAPRRPDRAVVYTVLALAYLVQPALPGPSRVDRVQALRALIHSAMNANEVARAEEAMRALAQLPLQGVRADDAGLVDALQYGIRRLAVATKLRQSCDAHPALALASVYDSCIEAGIVLPPEALSSVIASMARSLPPDALLAVLDALQHDFLARGSRGEYSVVCAFLAAYGRASRPDRGEVLLQTYAGKGQGCRALALPHKRTSARAAAFLERTRMRNAPTDVGLSDWAAHTALWNALIRARTCAGDLAAASVWLERYRFVAHAPRSVLGGVAPPRRSASPYLTLMHAMSSAPGIRALFQQSSSQAQAALRRQSKAYESPFRSAAIHSVLRLVHQDGVVPGVAMLNFLTSFEAGRGRVDHAAAFALQAFAMPSSDAYRVHRTTYAPLFTLYAAAAQHAESPHGIYDASPLPRSDASLAPLLDTLATPRGVWKSCMASLATQSRAAQRSFLAAHGVPMLNNALHAMLSARDYPAALCVLRAYTALGVDADMYTYACVWNHLPPAHGATPWDAVCRAASDAVLAQVDALRARKSAVPAWAAHLCSSAARGADLVALAERACR